MLWKLNGYVTEMLVELEWIRVVDGWSFKSELPPSAQRVRCGTAATATWGRVGKLVPEC